MIKQETVIITIFLVTLLSLIPRRYILLPFIVAACFVPSDQRIIVMGLDFTILRMLIVAGVLRMAVRQEIRHIKFNSFDLVLAAWLLCGTFIYVLQWTDTSAIIYKCGFLFDVIGLYWLFRQNLRQHQAIQFAFTAFAWCALIMLPLVAFEKMTGRNPFLILGQVTTALREEQYYRCQASFPHSIILGAFWATLIPVFVGLGVAARQGRTLYWLACIASVFMVFATSSATPIATLIAILILLALFPYRSHGKQIAYGICGMIILLHVVMKAPVWNLVTRIHVVSGSTGYHRFRLIDRALSHFNEWALLGTRNTADWGFGMEDLTNQYVSEGVRGGVLTLILFVILLVLAVKKMGQYSLMPIGKQQQWIFWGICVSILGHCIAFIGVSYFGQIRMLLYLILAVVGTIYEKAPTESFKVIATVPVHTSVNRNGCLHSNR
jgi:hypothetical protein